MDGDYTEPVLTPSIGLLSDNINIVLSEGTSKTFRFTAQDNKELDYLELAVLIWKSWNVWILKKEKKEH